MFRTPASSDHVEKTRRLLAYSKSACKFRWPREHARLEDTLIILPCAGFAQDNPAEPFDVIAEIHLSCWQTVRTKVT